MNGCSPQIAKCLRASSPDKTAASISCSVMAAIGAKVGARMGRTEEALMLLGVVVPHLERARAMSERSQVFNAERFVTAQVFGPLALRHEISSSGRVGTDGSVILLHTTNAASEEAL